MPSTFHKVGSDLTLLFNQLCQQFEKSSTPPNNQQQCWPTFCIPEVENNIPTFHTLHFTTTKGPVLGRFFHSFSSVFVRFVHSFSLEEFYKWKAGPNLKPWRLGKLQSKNSLLTK